MTNRTRMAAAAAAALSMYLPLRAAAETDFTFYGRLNLSVDVGSQGLAGVVCNNPHLCTPGSRAQGNLRWIPAVASNLSRFGIRGHHDLLDGIQAVFQLEAEVAVAALPESRATATTTPSIQATTPSTARLPRATASSASPR